VQYVVKMERGQTLRSRVGMGNGNELCRNRVDMGKMSAETGTKSHTRAKLYTRETEPGLVTI